MSNLKGWNFHVHREFPRKFESTILGRETLSREIGRIRPPVLMPAFRSPEAGLCERLLHGSTSPGALREMGGAPRNPAPRKWCGLSNNQAATAQMGT